MAEHMCACFADGGLRTFRRSAANAYTNAHLHADGGNPAHTRSERSSDGPGRCGRRNHAGATGYTAGSTSTQRTGYDRSNDNDWCNDHNRRDNNDNKCAGGNNAGRR